MRNELEAEEKKREIKLMASFELGAEKAHQLAYGCPCLALY